MIRYDPRRSLYEQFAGQNPGMNQTIFVSHEYEERADPDLQQAGSIPDYSSVESGTSRPSPADEVPSNGSSLRIPNYGGGHLHSSRYGASPQPPNSHAHVFSRTLFEGSPAYKRRRMRSRQGTSPSVIDDSGLILHRASPAQLSYTSDMRSMTNSPRMYSQVLRKVSGAIVVPDLISS